MARLSTRVQGLKELQASLGEISAAAAKGALKRALVKSSKPIAQAMSDFAPVDDGTLSGSIRIEGDVQGGIAGTRAYAEARRAGASKEEAASAQRAANKANPRQYQAQAIIGPDAEDGAHAHLVEYGTGPRYHKSGRFVGIMPPDPFIRPAWDKEGGAVAQDRIKEELVKELDKAKARARARAARKV